MCRHKRWFFSLLFFFSKHFPLLFTPDHCLGSCLDVTGSWRPSRHRACRGIRRQELDRRKEKCLDFKKKFFSQQINSRLIDRNISEIMEMLLSIKSKPFVITTVLAVPRKNKWTCSIAPARLLHVASVIRSITNSVIERKRGKKCERGWTHLSRHTSMNPVSAR